MLLETEIEISKETKCKKEYIRYNYVKTGLVLLYALIAMISNLFILAIVHERVPIKSETLPDLGFDLLPRVDWAIIISDFIIIIEFILVILIVITHKNRQLLLRRFCLIIGTLYIFRGICMISTVFSVANDKHYCAPQLNKTQSISKVQFVSVIFGRVWYMMWGMGLSVYGKNNYCGDFMYSGHTSMLTLCYLMINEYLLSDRLRASYLKLLNLFIFFLSCAGVVCLIVSRDHYSIDILVAYYATTRVFWIYHTMAQNKSLLNLSASNPLSKVWWFPLFQYFENNL